MTAKILLVEDEAAIRDAVSYALRQDGFEVEVAADGERGLTLARAARFDVVLLDVMLPRLSGTEICRTLRAESDVPIIMLTARDAEVDRVLGLELGADDLAALSDRDLLEQVLVNLAANAARHTDSGSIVLAARPNGRHELAIELRDTGTGISREHRDRIFDRFYRGGNRDGDGFGLGLAIVRASVQALGGSVACRCAPCSTRSPRRCARSTA